MRSRPICSILILLALLSGCAVGPDYRRPSIDAPESWRVEETRAKDVANTEWWGQFEDPVLNDMILTALRENKDIQLAAARVEEFMGRYQVSRSALFPQAYGAAAASRTQTSDRVNVLVPDYADNPWTEYLLAGSAFWEIDLWGKVRRANEAARATLLSTDEARNTVILTLVCGVASAYVELRNLDRQLEIAESTLTSRENTLKLFTKRYQRGVI
jgi:multidrug efflux system outer membrane protein